ncbi:hypothetical protein G9A89_010817 [Geosiphon pyriformis]|nr:hypothetical protein G9A89_010817 [Geosiphon pyriformis]
MVKLAFVGPLASTTCAGLSFAGIIFLLILGALFDAEVEGLTESNSDPDNPHIVAQTCYLAALIYGGFFLTCGCQALVHKKQSRSQIRL